MAEGVKIAARNQKAFHEYFIDEKFEAGIELTGTEVKSIRLGTLSLKEAWCQIKDGQLFIRQMHIAPYDAAVRQGEAGRICADPAERLFPRQSRQGRGCACKGQKALRQA